MKILSLRLSGNKRLLLSGTREVDYTPKSSIQLIIGNNGSGKSTLLNELSPLPALKSEYVKGGLKDIVIQCRGYYYRLISDFTKDQSHRFIRGLTMEDLTDENNLNEGHTLTVQKQLVEEHLRYTNEVHDLLLGNIRLTTLSPQKRKEWFVKLCDVDVTYAVEVYQRLASNARNALGAKRHTEQKLLDEKSRLLGPEELQDLKDQIAQYSKRSRLCSELMTPLGTVDVHSLEHQLSTQLREIDVLSHQLIEGVGIPLYGAKDTHELRDLLEQSKRDVSITEERIDSLKREYESIEELVGLMSNDDGRSSDSIRAELSELERRLSEVVVDSELVMREDLKALLSDASSIADPLDDLLLRFPLNRDLSEYNRERFADAENELSKVNDAIDKIKYSINVRVKRLEELKRHEPTECPNCNHVWVPGVSENEVERLGREIPTFEAKLPELNAARATILEYLERTNVWKDAYAKYSAYVREYPRLSFIWDYCLSDNRIYNNPSSLVGVLRKLISRITTALDVRSIMDRRDVMQSALMQREKVEGDSGKRLTQRAEYLEDTLGKSQRLLEQQKLQFAKLNDAYTQVMRLLEKRDTLEQRLNSVSTLLIKKDQYVKNQLLDKEIDELLLTIAGLTKRLNDAMGKVQVVEHLESTLKELTQAEADYKVLLQELSPTEGLIADSLMGFINAVTNQMNFIISRIWSTDLKVLPCHAESGDLDYKFPLKFGSDLTVGDVALGSKGQKELVDYVFVLIAMIYLDLKDYPLLMDEVGHSFHDVHRIKLFDYIKQLLEQGTVGQIFVVSHFSNTHGSLTHADINVIDNTGVLVPPNANRFFTIK